MKLRIWIRSLQILTPFLFVFLGACGSWLFIKIANDKIRCYFFEYDIGNFYEWFRMIKKAVSKDERAWFFSLKEKRAKTVSERIFHAGENQRVFVSTDLILS